MTGRPSGRRTHRCPPEHKHGETSTCYGHGCGCDDCRAGAARRYTVRNRQIVYGRYDNGFTDATPSREHLFALTEFGIPLGRIEKMVGRQRRWLEYLMHGRNGHLQTQIAKDNEARILAVPLDPRLRARTGCVNILGARRRLQALQTLGWTFARLQAEAGLPAWQYFDRVASEGEQITPERDKIIRDLYDRLWNTRPTFPNGLAADAGRRAAAKAKASGWASPMDWDDIDTDPAPANVPRDRRSEYVDEVVVDLALTGHAPRALYPREAERVVTILHARGLTDTQIARQSGVLERTVFRIRHERLHLPAVPNPHSTTRPEGVAA